MLRATPGHRTLPRGTARDWPRFRERGYLLDVGRKYWSPDYNNRFRNNSCLR